MTAPTADERGKLVDFLRTHCRCETLTPKEVDRLIDYTELMDLGQGEIIADIGEVGEALYFIIQGEAVIKHGPLHDEVEVGRMREGELMGSVSFFDREPRDIRLRAGRKRTRMLRLSYPMYMRLRVEAPFIAVNLLEYAIISLDNLVRRTSKDVANLSLYLYSTGKR